MAEEKDKDKLLVLRDELVRNALQARKGDIKPNVANAVTNALKSAVYAESIRLGVEKKETEIKVDIQQGATLSEADRERLDRVVGLFSSCKIKEGKNDRKKARGDTKKS